MSTQASRKAAPLPKATITYRRDVTDDLWVIRLMPEALFTFKPGQYCTIGVEGVERAYSIVSAPHEEELELFFELVPPPTGQLTPLLYELLDGAEVTMRPRAKGLFTFKEQWANHFMVSTVTGVCPSISILRDYLHYGRSGHRFYVLEGASYGDELTYDAELREMESRHPELITFVPTVSRPQEERNRGWTGESGRVNTIVQKYLERFGLDPSSTLVYACGHPGMIEDVKEQLLPKGWTVEEERFWKE